MRIKPGTFIRVFAYDGDYEPRKINLAYCVEFNHEDVEIDNPTRWHGKMAARFCNRNAFLVDSKKGQCMEVLEFRAVKSNGEEVRGFVDKYDLKDILEDAE